MYIKSLFIPEYRNLRNVTLGEFSQTSNQSELVVLAGPNGSGKTSILDAIGGILGRNLANVEPVFRRTMNFRKSLEVCLGISTPEKELIREYLQSRPNEKARFGPAAAHIEQAGSFYLYSDLEHPEDYTNVTNLVNTVLSEIKRPPVIYIRSDRYYLPLNFNPAEALNYEEETNRWHFRTAAVDTPEVQFKQTFDYLLQQPYHYLMNLGLHYKNKLHLSNNPEPPDPLRPYNELLGSLFPGYEFADMEGRKPPTNLFINLPSGKKIEFNDLSSGEKEVFFILCFFLRFNINNTLILIDEPELHLHPELARRFIRTMLELKPGNQIWLATHNTEIIDEAGRDKTIFVALDHNTREPVVIRASDESHAEFALKQFISYSGFIGITGNMVFLEGLESSSDRKMFSRLFPQYSNKIKFVPSKSTNELERINTMVLSIISEKVGWMKYYLIRDRDFLTPMTIAKFQHKYSGKMYVLKRNQIENYLIDFDIITEVLRETFGRNVNSSEVQARLTDVARKLSGEVLRDMLEFRLHQMYSPQDFSLGNFMNSQPVIDNAGSIISQQISTFEKYIVEKVNSTNKDLTQLIDESKVKKLISECLGEVQDGLNSAGKNGWVTVFPGKRLLERYAQQEQLSKPPAFINLLIKQMAATPDKIPSELKSIVNCVAKGEEFPIKWYD